MKDLLRSISVLAFFTLLAGVAYPFLVTGIGQLFPMQANGSLIRDSKQIIGSSLIAQKFMGAGYFHARPSASDFATVPSGASNAALTNRAWPDAVLERKRNLQGENPEADVPADLLTASASGLDPHISPEAAFFQLKRIEKARNLSETQKRKLEEIIQSATEGPTFGILGKERVNVLLLNLQMDKL